jgi:hypothetical protein
MTRRFEKDYIIATEILRVARAFTGTDGWRAPPDNHLWDLAETPGSNPQIYLNNDAGKFE